MKLVKVFSDEALMKVAGGTEENSNLGAIVEYDLIRNHLGLYLDRNKVEEYIGHLAIFRTENSITGYVYYLGVILKTNKENYNQIKIEIKALNGDIEEVVNPVECWLYRNY